MVLVVDGVGEEGVVSGSDGGMDDMLRDVDLRGTDWAGERGGDMAGAVTGAISFATRLSMKVRNVKETLWAGDEERVSRTQD